VCRSFFTNSSIVIPSRPREIGLTGGRGRVGGRETRGEIREMRRFQLRERMLMHTRLIDNVVASH